MQSTSTVTEAILAFGLYGGGKTHSWATIAEHCREADDGTQFYVIGTEYGAVGRLADAYDNFNSNVQCKDVSGWLECADWTTEILSKIKRGDWIIIEGIDKPWHWVQSLWDELHGPKLDIDPRDPFSMQRGVTEVQRDWVKINGVYRNWINPILRSDAHVFACGPQDALRMPNPSNPKAWSDDKEVLEQYSQFGFRPAGQKELGHHFHTVLWMKNPMKGKYQMVTVDDHGRNPSGTVIDVNNFVLDYLLKVAKWEI